MAEYYLTPAAEHDLEGIWAYTFQRWGAEQANQYIDVLTKTFAELAQSPRLAPACEHIQAGYRHHIIKKHVIYFRTTPYGIAIIRILHDRMDAQRHL